MEDYDYDDYDFDDWGQARPENIVCFIKAGLVIGAFYFYIAFRLGVL